MLMTDSNSCEIKWHGGYAELVPSFPLEEKSLVSISPIIPGPETKSLQPVTTIPSDQWIGEGVLTNDPIAIIQHPYGVYQPISYFTLWAYFKDSPEVIACVTAIVEDIMSDGYTLEGEKENIARAEDYTTRNQFKSKATSMLFDSFVTGDGYLYQTALTDRAIKSMIWKLLPMETKSFDTVNQILYEVKAENKFLMSPKELQYVPSSTVRIDYNINGDVNQYIQWVGSQWRWFRPTEIIHFKLMDLDGKVYGYTPMQSILKEMDIITNIKDYAKYFFEKGGVPNYAWIFEDEQPNSPTIKAVKKILQTYAQLPNKWKSLVLTGKVEMKEIQALKKDMEFRELARYLTQVIVNVFGVPASRLPGLLLDSNIKGALSSEGYYRKISHWQDRLQDLWNAAIFSKFDVKMKFNRTYLQDEIRDVQAIKIKSDISMQLFNAGVVNESWVWNFLKIPDERRGDMKPKNQMQGNNPFKGQDELNKHQVMSESTDLAADQRKQEMANQSGK